MGVTPTANLTVAYATADGTATAGSDYTALTWDADLYAIRALGIRRLPSTPSDDSLDDDDETFTVSISNPQGGGGPALPPSPPRHSSVTTTITDDDGTPMDIELSVSDTSIGEADGADRRDRHGDAGG